MYGKTRARNKTHQTDTPAHEEWLDGFAQIAETHTYPHDELQIFDTYSARAMWSFILCFVCTLNSFGIYSLVNKGIRIIHMRNVAKCIFRVSNSRNSRCFVSWTNGIKVIDRLLFIWTGFGRKIYRPLNGNFELKPHKHIKCNEIFAFKRC